MTVTPRRTARSWPVLALLCLAPAANAAQVLSVRVAHHDAQFVVRMRVRIDAPAPAVFRALQDYRAMSRYNPNLRLERIQAMSDPESLRVYTTLHACVLFFCKTVHQEQIITAHANAHGGVLQATLIPRGGDFKAAGGRWLVGPCADHAAPTCLRIRIAFVPAFWIPPLIGPWIIRAHALAAARRASAGLQQIALGPDASTPVHP